MTRQTIINMKSLFLSAGIIEPPVAFIPPERGIDSLPQHGNVEPQLDTLSIFIPQVALHVKSTLLHSYIT
jgi:hypothetical protein